MVKKGIYFSSSFIHMINHNYPIPITCRNPGVDEALNFGNTFNSLKNQLSVGFNMLFTIFATFGMGYYLCIHLKFTQTEV